MKTFYSVCLFVIALLYSVPGDCQSCDVPLTNNNCNQIFNNNLTPIWADCFNSWGFNPFARCFPDWGFTHGTPQVNLTSPSIGQNINHACMWAYNNAILPNQMLRSEGIATRIPNLLPGHKYAITFFRRTRPDPGMFGFNGAPDLDEVNIRLIMCNDYLTINAMQSDDFPNPPTNSQAIFCETNVNQRNWQRVAQTFVANDNYDIVCIYPRQYALWQWWLDFGQLELIDVTNFNAGPPPNPISPDCLVNIGPLTPNCGITGATYTWHGPNGQVVAAPANQQIPVNTADPTQVGVWTLQMDIPNIVTTNNTCSNRFDASATVNVPACQNCLNPPQILASSYFDPNCNNPHQTLIPYQLNSYCVPWECGSSTYLEANFASGNQWYVNDVLITGNGGNIPNIGQVLISNNTKQLSHSLSSVSNGNQLIKFQLKNTTGGCNDLTTPTYVFYGETLFPTEEMGNYKPNFNRVISTPLNYSYGPGAIYTWNIPGAVITDIDPSTPDAMAYFPANIPIPDVTGTLTVTNSAYCNGVYNLHFNYNPNARVSNIMLKSKPSISDEKIIIKSKIYPNPAASLITIESTSIIQSILISNELGLLSKSVRSRGKKTIYISIIDLKPGIYSCQIITEKGIENQKLIIKQ